MSYYVTTVFVQPFEAHNLFCYEVKAITLKVIL
jgi:hypothetical protein